jgi:DGQHR domain-containing protein
MKKKIGIPCLKIDQPIGQFYVGVISHADLLEISYVDQRTLESDIDDYMGIQRKLSPSRVKKIKEYVRNVDATFPTSVILSIEDKNCRWNENARELTISASSEDEFKSIAKILDGQHRVEGLKDLGKDNIFELSVTIFVEVDVATQANIFATVNLAQTKVNRSLVYDLFSYEKVRSPQKSCHEITVALNDRKSSPLYQRIKRLGVATPGIRNETLTQAAVVESLLDFISKNPTEDRNKFKMRLKNLHRISDSELQRLPFRNMWLDGKEEDIAKIIFNYFSAVTNKWPDSWENLRRKGNVLPKTNGFKALMRFLKPVYLELSGSKNGRIPTIQEFSAYFKEVKLSDEDFNIKTFPPGSSGESILYKNLFDQNFDG